MNLVHRRSLEKIRPAFDTITISYKILIFTKLRNFSNSVSVSVRSLFRDLTIIFLLFVYRGDLYPYFIQIHQSEWLWARLQSYLRRYRLGHDQIRRCHTAGGHETRPRGRRTNQCNLHQTYQIGVREMLLPVLAHQQETLRWPVLHQPRQIRQNGLQGTGDRSPW